MPLRFSSLFSLGALVLTLSCTSQNLQDKPIGLINNVEFNDSKFDNPNASNGFLVNHKGATYAITAKHVLMIAKTDNMKFPELEGELKQWKMHPKGDESAVVILDKLLNPNHKDSLTWNYMGNNWDTYNDWLVFSIKENHTKHVPLEFRSKPLSTGDKLFVIGWAYSDTLSTQPMYEYNFDKTEGDYHSLIQLKGKGPASLGGLSGSPVLDEEGKVVGLVSLDWEDESTGIVYLDATSCKGIVGFLEGLE